MKKYTIAIVDDDPDDSEILATALEQNYDDLKVITFQIANDFLEFIELNTIPPNIIVVDFFMPVMNGYELIQILKKNEKLKSSVIIILSTVDRERLVKAELHDQAIKSFIKPLTLIEYSTLADKIVKEIH